MMSLNPRPLLKAPELSPSAADVPARGRAAGASSPQTESDLEPRVYPPRPRIAAGQASWLQSQSGASPRKALFQNGRRTFGSAFARQHPRRSIHHRENDYRTRRRFPTLEINPPDAAARLRSNAKLDLIYRMKWPELLQRPSPCDTACR